MHSPNHTLSSLTYTDNSCQSVTPPLYLSSTFIKQSKTNQPRTRSKHFYARNTHPNGEIVSRQLSALYQTNMTILFPSGIAAVGAVFWCGHHEESRSVFVVDTELYSDDETIWRQLQKKIELVVIRHSFLDVEGIQAILEAEGSDVKMLYFESCSNPSGRTVDIGEIAGLRKEYCPDAVIAVDNSWLSGIVYNPIEHGADVVVESSTKHCGGGKIVGGFVTGMKCKGGIMNRILVYKKTFGFAVSAYDCWDLSQSLETLPLRVNFLSQNTLPVAQWLEACPFVNRVLYPLLESSPTYEYSIAHFKGGPAQLLFHISETDKDKVYDLIEGSEIILFATSYGKSHALFDPFPLLGKDTDYDPIQTDSFVCGFWLRFSMGWGVTASEVINELDMLFHKYLPINDSLQH